MDMQISQHKTTPVRVLLAGPDTLYFSQALFTGISGKPLTP